uniref:Uncharacterized protein n=1 Tax=Escherichia phage PMBT16 TaxID=3137282 RepID=A0AAU8BT33_9VIRU
MITLLNKIPPQNRLKLNLTPTPDLCMIISPTEQRRSSWIILRM